MCENLMTISGKVNEVERNKGEECYHIMCWLMIGSDSNVISLNVYKSYEHVHKKFVKVV